MKAVTLIYCLATMLALVGCSRTINLPEGFQRDLVNAANERTKHSIRYDGRYMEISYPSGDVPADMGVCTDVIIRSFRSVGVDLQRLVHEDMVKNFNKYPSKRIWGLTSPDTNIDHRRVPILQTFFRRAGASLDITHESKDYLPGDIVTWDLPGRSPWHIGIITDKKSNLTGRPLVVHNFGKGPITSDMIFDYKITGHYRYAP